MVKLFFSHLFYQNPWKKQKEKSKTKTRFCKVCFNEFSYSAIYSLLTPNPVLCDVCFSQTKPILKEFATNGVKAFTIYPYDDFVKSNLYQLKGCFDIELAPIFLDRYKFYLSLKYLDYIIVPAPSHKIADDIRGFNHVEEIFKSLPNKQCACIKKIVNMKQSDLHYQERQNIKNNLVYVEKFNIRNKKILIVDDVYTTGSTVNAMIDILKSKHPKKIEVLVLSKVLDRKMVQKHP